jgi:membrane peptidoglycan carboxypeptidase
MEDSAFPYHKGYLTEAFQNSLVDNLAKGKFARGGSTITQQTAKNLWLGRQKTILRKVDELFLAQALESCLTKDQILETYLNIVEFGPDIYGVQEGARHWFGKSPDALEPNEAFWLASILPAPKRATAPTDEDLKRVGRIMASLAAQGKIPDFGTDIDVSDVPEWEAPH